VIRFGWKGIVIASVSSVVLISIAFFASFGFHSRIKSVYQEYQHYDQIHHQTSVGQRIEMYDIAKRMIHERPWFGYGTGGIRTALPSVVPEKNRPLNPSIDYVESIYLDFLLEFGVFGFVILLIVLVVQISVSFQLPQCYRALMQAVLIALLFGGVFNAFLVSFPIAHFYALFSAVCFSAYKGNV
jgi:O-antigen ligase